MNDSVQRDALESAEDQPKPAPAPPPPPAPSQLCFYCGARREPGARYCAACKRYQPDALDSGGKATAVSVCLCCRELIPAGAAKCNHCSSFQTGVGSWLPTSSASISALGALASLVILLFNTIYNRPPAPYSETDLEVYGYESPRTLNMRVVNLGGRPSFVGRGWGWLAPVGRGRRWLAPALDATSSAACTLRRAEEPCSTLRKALRSGVFPLEAPPQSTLVAPGHGMVPFQRKRALELDEIPRSLTRDNIDTEIRHYAVCLAFEVFEYQEPEPRCVVRVLTDVSAHDYLGFVKDATFP